jgi:hypothetical protein
VAHPAALTRRAAMGISSMLEAIRQGRGASRMSFNRPVGSSRRISAMHLELDALKAVARREGVKVNDVFLYLIAAALRHALLARGDRIEGESLRISVAVSGMRFGRSVSGNHAGTVIVSIPVDVEDPRDLLPAVAAATARAKAKQLPVMSTGLMVLLGRAGITRLFIRHQHMLNVLTTNLPGPPIPLYFAGGQVRNPIAIPPIAGNVTISFAALSYDGALTLSVVGDGEVWSDLGPVIRAMQSAWTALLDALGAPLAA